MKTFSGLCVGGPSAGRMVTHDGPLLRVHRPKAIRLEEIDPDQPCEFETFDYRHEYLRDNTGDEIGFWVPEGRTLLSALKEMGEIYAASRHVSKGAA